MIKKFSKVLQTKAKEFKAKILIDSSMSKAVKVPVYQTQADKTLDDYWQKRACAAACLSMVIKTIGKDNSINLNKLVLMVLESGGYDIKTDTGWYHSSIVHTAEKFNLKAKRHRNVGFYSQAKLIKEGNYLLSSLKSPQGGHMILLYGTEVAPDREVGFIYHDPSWTSGGKSKFITKKEFSKLSKNQAISIKA